jgi:hypothetical protein
LTVTIDHRDNGGKERNSGDLQRLGNWVLKAGAECLLRLESGVPVTGCPKGFKMLIEVGISF